MTYENDVLTPFVGDGEEGTPESTPEAPETTEEVSSDNGEGETPATKEDGEESTPEATPEARLDEENGDGGNSSDGDGEESPKEGESTEA